MFIRFHPISSISVNLSIDSVFILNVLHCKSAKDLVVEVRTIHIEVDRIEVLVEIRPIANRLHVSGVVGKLVSNLLNFLIDVKLNVGPNDWTREGFDKSSLWEGLEARREDGRAGFVDAVET